MTEKEAQDEWDIARENSIGKEKTIGEILQKKIEKLEKENRELKEFIYVYGGKDIDINNITATKVMTIRQEGFINGLKEAEDKYRRLIKDMIPKYKINNLIEQIRGAIDFIKTDKDRRNRARNTQKIIDLELEIIHLEKLLGKE